MGTNFYARVKPCKHCNITKEEIHIGKSSIGWTFTFHATDEIKSYKDWIKFLSKEDVKIFNEYDDEFTIEQFSKLVKRKKLERYCSHATQCDDGSYLDKEGNSMSPHEFF